MVGSKIYNSVSQLPANWDDLAKTNIFLSTAYLEVLEKSAPINMTCRFIGLFHKDTLVGIAVSQFLNLNKLESFGERDKCLKSHIRNLLLKNFSSHVLFVGNNMLTGQNAFYFSDTIDVKHAIKALYTASKQLEKEFKLSGKKIHITTFKDFYAADLNNFIIPEFKKNYIYSAQPNMVFDIQKNWISEQDYIDALLKKYRDQYKRARKKAIGIEKKKMNLEEIIKHEKTIYDLYFHVAKNAPFNSFFLAENHFQVLKQKLKDDFLFYGYFIDENLIGFNTLIKNGNEMDTYFLGYDDEIQKEKMLYLNMLYDMIAYSINKGFKKITFARTALEIKSSVGAKPIKMYGFMEHRNAIINKYMYQIFPYLEPEVIWQERNPFK